MWSCNCCEHKICLFLCLFNVGSLTASVKIVTGDW
jgi:hypothetical protein